MAAQEGAHASQATGRELDDVQVPEEVLAALENPREARRGIDGHRRAGPAGRDRGARGDGGGRHGGGEAATVGSCVAGHRSARLSSRGR